MTYKVEDKLPRQKDLVLVEVKGVVMTCNLVTSHLEDFIISRYSITSMRKTLIVNARDKRNEFEIKNVEKCVLDA